MKILHVNNKIDCDFNRSTHHRDSPHVFEHMNPVTLELIAAQYHVMVNFPLINYLHAAKRVKAKKDGDIRACCKFCGMCTWRMYAMSIELTHVAW